MIVLAAGTGSRLAPLTDDRPKCLVPLGHRPLLDWTRKAAQACGIDDIVAIGGHCIDALRAQPIRVLENRDYARTNMVRTLFRAAELFGDDWYEWGLDAGAQENEAVKE